MATEISTMDDLQAIQGDLSGDYVLTDDLDALDYDWTPIGDQFEGPFTGTFDGNGHTIDGLSLDNGTDGPAALFGLAYGCTIKNVRLHNVWFQGAYAAGLIATGQPDLVGNIEVTGRIEGEYGAGGIIARVEEPSGGGEA
ncbi:ZmpA/ZmpB/ZmpC family metallo-endopeptidase-related protein [Natronobacterium lacisalsi]|nr:ZmpA/ZmpB/ZmpC family metallo-endopeptidase-related protein [Halobiforma lacisalsi]